MKRKKDVWHLCIPCPSEYGAQLTKRAHAERMSRAPYIRKQISKRRFCLVSSQQLQAHAVRMLEIGKSARRACTQIQASPETTPELARAVAAQLWDVSEDIRKTRKGDGQGSAGGSEQRA